MLIHVDTDIDLTLATIGFGCRIDNIHILYNHQLDATNPKRPVRPRKTNLEHCVAEIEKKGYSCRCFPLDATWYGLPQSRKRIFIVCLSLSRPEVGVSAEVFFQSVKALLEKMYVKPPPVDPYPENLEQPSLYL